MPVYTPTGTSRRELLAGLAGLPAVRSGRVVGSGVADSGTGSLERVTGETSWPETLGAAGLGAGVAGVASGAYAQFGSRRSERDTEDEASPHE